MSPKLDDPIPEATRSKYQLRVPYHSDKGDKGWTGRVSARGKLSDGRIIELLAESGDFHMGGHGKRLEDVEFPLNR
jgi:hypothetical protein